MTNHETYAPANVEPAHFEDPERHQDAMREAAEVVTYTSDNGQQFSGLHVNRDFTNRPAFIRVNSMFGSSEGADQQYIAYQYAATFPEHSFLLIDLPSHGRSDNLTAQQSSEIRHAGTFSGVAEAHAQAITNRAPHLKGVIGTGEALGARMTTELATKGPEHGLHFLKLMAFDMAGLEDRNSAGLGLGFLANVMHSRKRYKDGEANEHLQKAFEEDFKTDLENYGPVITPTAKSESSVWKKDKSLLTFLISGSPLATASGAESLERALEVNRYLSANLVFGGLSAVGRLNDRVKERLEDIEERVGPGRIQTEVWPNDDQGVGYAPHVPRLLKYIADNR